MLDQPPYSNRFYLQTKKWLCRKLCWGTIFLKYCMLIIFVEHDTSVQSTSFDWYVSYICPYESHHFYMLGQRGVLKFPCKTYVVFLCWGAYWHMFVMPSITLKLLIFYYYYLEKTIVHFIYIIKNVSIMSWEPTPQ